MTRETRGFSRVAAGFSRFDEDFRLTPRIQDFPVAQMVKTACSAGDLGLIPGLGRFPGEGKGYPLQYSGLEKSMDAESMGMQKYPWHVQMRRKQ